MQILHMRRHFRGWKPPQSASLLMALVRGLSGDVGKLGTWSSQYGAAVSAALYGDAQVNSNGLVLDGSGDYVRPDNTGTPFNRTAFTVSLWAYLAGDCALFAVYNQASPYNGYAVRRQSTYLKLFQGDTSSNQNVDSGLSIGTNAWTFVAVRKNGNDLTFDVGSSKAAKTGTVTPTFGSTAPFLGAFDSWEGLVNGRMDCVYYWSSILSDEELLSVRTADPYRRG